MDGTNDVKTMKKIFVDNRSEMSIYFQLFLSKNYDNHSSNSLIYSTLAY